MSATVIHGEALEELRRLADNSIDSLVTDPPAGIGFMGKEWDDYGRQSPPVTARATGVLGMVPGRGGQPDDVTKYRRRAKAGFIATLTPIFAECLRVLKPGAHGLVWALPRTSHWTATALEDAGFEVRDVVTHHFGSGFPKSLDVSKAIDKAAGAEFVTEDAAGVGFMRPDGRDGYNPTLHRLVQTSSPTDGAKAWQGWGTALKPATEHWLLVRKPLGESSVAANVLKHGTGAINIDACRIGVSGGVRSSGEPNYRNNVYGKGMGGCQIDPEAVLGRWPANLVLTHGDGCVLIGTKEVRGSFIDAPSLHEFKPFAHGGLGGPRPARGIGNADNLETVEDWRCAPGCPVAELDRQSGDVGGGFGTENRAESTGRYGDFSGATKGSLVGFGDEGGASRFFYCAKPSRNERDTGLDGLEPQLRNDGRNAEHDTPALRRNLRTNHHPTVKAAELMCYLCRLITPPKGTVLDPFMGSGSTGIAALRSGFSFVGIEREGEYAEIARRRIVGDAPLFNSLTP